MTYLPAYTPLLLVFAALIGQTFLIWKIDRGLKRLINRPGGSSHVHSSSPGPLALTIEARLSRIEDDVEQLNLRVSTVIANLTQRLGAVQPQETHLRTADQPFIMAEEEVFKASVPSPKVANLEELVRDFNEYAATTDPALLEKFERKYEIGKVGIGKFGEILESNGDNSIISCLVGGGLALLPSPMFARQFKDKKHRGNVKESDVEKCYKLLTDETGVLKIVWVTVAEQDGDGWKMGRRGALEGFV